MKIDVLEHGAERLAEYAAVSIAFRVSEVLDLDAIALNPSAIPIPTRPVAAPYIKDYDTVPGDAPLDWPARFDVSRWTFLGTLMAETQDVNVPACRFYARQGFMLGAVNHGAYPDLPNEVQLLWQKERAPEQRLARRADGSI